MLFGATLALLSYSLCDEGVTTSISDDVTQLDSFFYAEAKKILLDSPATYQHQFPHGVVDNVEMRNEILEMFNPENPQRLQLVHADVYFLLFKTDQEVLSFCNAFIRHTHTHAHSHTHTHTHKLHTHTLCVNLPEKTRLTYTHAHSHTVS